MTNDDASKHLGGRKGKQQTMKTNTKQGAAYTTWARFAPCFLRFQGHFLGFLCMHHHESLFTRRRLAISLH